MIFMGVSHVHHSFLPVYLRRTLTDQCEIFDVHLLKYSKIMLQIVVIFGLFNYELPCMSDQTQWKACLSRYSETC
jgi:hypothetical protein